MKRLVLKFGGTSVGTIEKIKKVANIIKKRFDKGNEIIVIVSAMSGATNDLKEKSNLISKNFNHEELDVLLSSGEQITCALLSGAIMDLGLKSRSWLGWQVPIITNNNHTSSQIIKIKTDEILNFISNKGVAVIAGFQGISMENRITTLGRGGSDLSAVAIAKFFKTDSCEIYTDVDGVLTTDPLINKKAKKIDKISYEEMLEMASLGAKVMQPNAVQAAMINDIPINVKSTFSEKFGTKIISENEIDYKKIVHDDRLAKVSIIGAGMIANAGVTHKMFRSLAGEKINILAISTSEIKISVLVLEHSTQKAVKALHKTFELD